MGIAFVNGSASISNTEFSLPNASTSLSGQTDDCALQVFINAASMVAGDQYRVRIYEKINGAAQVPVYEAYLDGVQAEGLVAPSMIVGDGWDVTMIRTAGASSTINWSLRKIT